MAGDDDDSMMPVTAPGCTNAAARMCNFATTSMEQDDKTNWDSESDKPEQQNYCPARMSDYEDWGMDNVIDMGDHPSRADEPPTVRDKRIEGASSIVKVPTIVTHPPDPTHVSTSEGSPSTEDEEDADRLASEGGDADARFIHRLHIHRIW